MRVVAVLLHAFTGLVAIWILASSPNEYLPAGMTFLGWIAAEAVGISLTCATCLTARLRRIGMQELERDAVVGQAMLVALPTGLLAFIASASVASELTPRLEAALGFYGARDAFYTVTAIGTAAGVVILYLWFARRASVTR